MKKISYLIVSILDEIKECALCITTSQTKAQAIGNRIFTSSSTIKTIVTLELNDKDFAIIYAKLIERDITFLIDNEYVKISERYYSVAFKILQLV